MNGPEHYQRAEEYLALAEDAHSNDDLRAEFRELAMVHATIAATAATAMVASGVPEDGDTAHAWRQLICVPKVRVTNGAER